MGRRNAEKTVFITLRVMGRDNMEKTVFITLRVMGRDNMEKTAVFGVITRSVMNTFRKLLFGRPLEDSVGTARAAW